MIIKLIDKTSFRETIKNRISSNQCVICGKKNYSNWCINTSYNHDLFPKLSGLVSLDSEGFQDVPLCHSHRNSSSIMFKGRACHPTDKLIYQQVEQKL